MGSSSDAPYSGSGTPTSVYSIYNAVTDALLLGENTIHASGVDNANFPTAFTTASQLTSTNVPEIATDFANASFFDALDITWCQIPVPQGGAGQSGATCTSNSGLPPAPITAQFTGTVQPAVASAAGNWTQLSGLIGNLGSVPSALNSADSATVTSSGTVTQLNTPMAYNVTLSAPSGGYILPAAFSFTFPAGLTVNTGLVGAEVNAAANGTSPSAIAAIEAQPPASAVPIGTVVLTSPLADSYGGSNNQLDGKIYAVQTGATSGQGSVTQPYLELWYGPFIYSLGSFPSTLSFPLTINFGLAATPIGPNPLPFSSLAMSFPAATSPVKSTSCTTLGTVTGTATDDVANLALLFGDTNDGLTSPTGTPAAVNLSASPTTVTNQCAVVAKPPKTTAAGSVSGLASGSPTVTIKVKSGTAFSSESIGLARGLKFVGSKTVAKEISVSGAKVKSAKVAGGKLVITFKGKTKSETVKTKKGLIKEPATLAKAVKKHKVKNLTFSVKAGSTALKVKVKA